MNNPLLFLTCVCFTLVGVGQTNTSDLKLDSILSGTYSNNAWTNVSSKSLFSYDASGRVSAAKYWNDWTFSSLRLVSENSLSYGMNNLIDSIESKFYDPSLAYKELIQYQYNANKLITEKLVKRAQLVTSYQNYSKHNWTYNAIGDTLSDVEYSWDSINNSWIIEKSIMLDYLTDGKLDRRKIEEYNGNSEVSFGSQYLYNYSGDTLKQVVNRIKMSQNSSYKPYLKYEFTYNMQWDTLETMTTYTINPIDTNLWDLYKIKTYQYNANGQCDVIEEHRFDNMVYVGIINKSVFTYNANGLLISQLDSSKIDGYGLMPRYKYEYAYNDTVLYEERGHSWYDGVFTMSYRMQYELFTGETFLYPWGTEALSWSKLPYRLDEINTCQNETGVCSETKTKYYYSEKATATNKILKDEIVIFPNPSSTAFNLTVTSSAVVSVFALDGTLVESFPANVGSNVFGNSLSAGVYFVSVSTSTGTATQKVVKQ